VAELLDLGGERVLVCEADGPPIDGDRPIVDLVGEALSSHASLIALPVGRLGPDFFQLRSGVAGTIVQKVVTYRLKLAIIGDISDQLAASDALRAWVRESNRGREVNFLPSFEALVARLSAAAPPREPGGDA
jgi:hypothetical protein